MRLFDYLFYRTYSFYKKKRDGTPKLMGCLVLMVVIFTTILSISSFAELLFEMPELVIEKYVILLVLLVMLYFLWRRYNNESFVKELVSRYKDEELSSKCIRGWLFILYLILVMLIPISIGYMRHNLGMDI